MYEDWELSQDWQIMKNHGNIQMEVKVLGALGSMNNVDFEEEKK